MFQIFILLQEELKAVRADRMGLRQEILQLEATLLERDERITDLQQHLNEVTEAMQQPQLEDGAVQVGPCSCLTALRSCPAPALRPAAASERDHAGCTAGAFNGQALQLGPCS